MKKLDKKDFLKRYNINDADFKKADISWDELSKIYEEYCPLFKRIESAAQNVSNTLSRCDGVHSTRFRAKNPEHLLEKIIRKRILTPDWEINAVNYTEKVTDLAGVRVLHIFKNDWIAIDSFIKKTWNLEETKIAYIRPGDSNECRQMFMDNGCDVKDHPKGYRSVHYLIKPSVELDLKIQCEIQVRTIFEEAWGDIDHKLRYPSYSTDPSIYESLALLNRIAGAGDELSSMIVSLASNLKASNAREATLKADIERLNKALSSKELKSKSNAAIVELVSSARSLTENATLQQPLKGVAIGMVEPYEFATALKWPTTASPSLNSTALGYLSFTSKTCVACGAVLPYTFFTTDQKDTLCSSCRNSAIYSVVVKR